jgi:hypothetical protein
MSNADLWTTKVKGASEEKIRRSYEVIALYNDTVATGDNDRLAITNQALRELSGVNGLLVGDWIIKPMRMRSSATTVSMECRMLKTLATLPPTTTRNMEQRRLPRY